MSKKINAKDMGSILIFIGLVLIAIDFTLKTKIFLAMGTGFVLVGLLIWIRMKNQQAPSFSFYPKLKSG